MTFTSYAERRGIEKGLEKAISEPVDHFDGLDGDFAEFFPELQEHVRSLTCAEPR